MGDQALGYPGAAGNLCQRTADIPELRQRIDRDRDQLGAAILAQFLVARRTASR